MWQYGFKKQNKKNNPKIICGHISDEVRLDWPKPVEVGVVVKPVGQRAVAVQGEALVEDMEGHVLKSVVVQRHLEEKIKRISMTILFKVAPPWL